MERRARGTLAYGARPGGTVALESTVAAPVDGVTLRMADAVKSAEVTALPATLDGRSTVLPLLSVRSAAEPPSMRSERRPRYRTVSRLGAGGIGEVVLAEDEDIGRSVAIKRLHDDSDPAGVMRFVDEIRVMGRLDHPNIAPVHDVGTDPDGKLYFVMKKLDGETLESILERLKDGDAATHARFPIPVRVRIFASVLGAIRFAHSRRIVHRDIKPANIMLGGFGEVVVLDWGIAKRLGDPLSDALDAAAPASDELPPGSVPRRAFCTRIGSLLGTPAYMAPEQARGDNHLVDERTDVYALSVLFYELLTLRHDLDDARDLQAVLDGVRKRTPPLACFVRDPRQAGVSMELSTFIARGMQKAPEDRFQNAGEMLEELERIERGDFRVGCPLTLAKRATVSLARAIDRNPRTVFLGLPLAALLCLVAMGLLIARAVS